MVAGKTFLRLAENLEGEEKIDIIGKFKSKNEVKRCCVRTVLFWLLSLPFPAIIQLLSGRQLDNKQRTNHTTCCRQNSTGLMYMNFSCYVNRGKTSFSGRMNRIHDLVFMYHYYETY